MSDEKNLNEEAEAVEAKAEEAAAEVAETVEEVETEAEEAVEETVSEVADEPETEVEAEVETEAEVTAEPETEVEEAAEEATEDVRDAAGLDYNEQDDTAMRMADADAAALAAEQTADEAADALREVEQSPEQGIDGKKVGIIAACAAAAVVLIAAIVVAAIIFLPKLFNPNKYEKYVDVTGRTIGEVAEQSGIDYKEFLEMYKLPADMPENTTEASAYNTIPFGVIIEMNQFVGMETVDDAKKVLELPDWVTEDTPWGEAIGEAPLRAYVGEANLDRFKESYSLGDDVTGDTLYKDVKNKVDEIDKQKREESEKQAQSAKEAKAEETQAPTDAPTEAPAEAPTQVPAAN